MKSLRTLLIIVLVWAGSNLTAQDIHFSQFKMSPLTLNPALTGAFEGTFRIGGIYRDQWSSFLQDQFVTPSVFIDAPIIRGFGKKDWVGVGAYVVSDQRGSGSLTTNTMMASVAYHRALDKKGNTYLSFGLQGGQVQERVDPQDLRFEDQFVNGVFDANAVSSDFPRIQDNINYTDFQFGALINSVVSRKLNFNAGASLYHIFNPDRSQLNGKDSLARRLQLHGGLNMDLTQKLVFSPAVNFQRQSGGQELNLQGYFGYHLNAQKDITAKIGAGYRAGDAVIAMIGFDFKGFTVGAAYDINTSDLSTVTANQGGFEVALSYIAKIYRTPIVKPVIFCPRF